MKKIANRCLALIFAGWCSIATAQMAPTPVQTAPARQPPTQSDIDPNSLAQGGLQALGLIDSNQIGLLWDGASQVAKQAARREEFIAKVTQTRSTLGKPTSHVWMMVRRQLVTQTAQGVPPGFYVTIEFATTFQSNKTVVEVVSLRRDEDGRWRFAGYFTKM